MNLVAKLRKDIVAKSINGQPSDILSVQHSPGFDFHYREGAY